MTEAERTRLRMLIDSRKRSAVLTVKLAGIDYHEQYGDITADQAFEKREKWRAWAGQAPAPVAAPAKPQWKPPAPIALRPQKPRRGGCHAFIKLGPRYSGLFRCSRRSKYGDYCGLHKDQAVFEQAQAA